MATDVLGRELTGSGIASGDRRHLAWEHFNYLITTLQNLHAVKQRFPALAARIDVELGDIQTRIAERLDELEEAKRPLPEPPPEEPE